MRHAVQEYTADSHPAAAYRDARVLVLGAAGFVGRWVAHALSGNAAELVLAVRYRRDTEVFSGCGVSGQVVEIDLDDAPRVRDLFRQARPSIVFNLAGYGVNPAERDEHLAFRLNAGIVKTTCEAMASFADRRWRGQQIIHAGSALEYGEIAGDLRESSQPNPTTVYGRSKLAGTLELASACRESGLRGLTARLFTVYGPGEHAGRLLPSLLEAANTGKPVALTAGTQRRDFIYVQDVAAAMLRLGVSGAEPGSVVNVASGRLLSVREFAETAASVLPIPPGCLQFGRLPVRASEMDHQPVSVERLEHLTGWRPSTTVAEGIRKTAIFENQRRTGVAAGDITP